MSQEGNGGTKPTGRGTIGGGGIWNPTPDFTGGSAAISNQQILVLDPAVLATLSEVEARSVAICQVKFARDVSAAAVTAYNGILEVLSEPLP